MEICEKITSLAKAQGESRASIERKAGIANGSIGSWKRKSPTLNKLQAVAKALGVKVADLIEEEEDGPAVQ